MLSQNASFRAQIHLFDPVNEWMSMEFPFGWVLIWNWISFYQNKPKFWTNVVLCRTKNVGSEDSFCLKNVKVFEVSSVSIQSVRFDSSKGPHWLEICTDWNNVSSWCEVSSDWPEEEVDSRDSIGHTSITRGRIFIPPRKFSKRLVDFAHWTSDWSNCLMSSRCWIRFLAPHHHYKAGIHSNAAPFDTIGHLKIVFENCFCCR